MFGAVHFHGENVTMSQETFLGLLKAERDLENEIDTTLDQQQEITRLETQVKDHESTIRNLHADLDGTQTARQILQHQLTEETRRKNAQITRIADQLGKMIQFRQENVLSDTEAAALMIYFTDPPLAAEYYAQCENWSTETSRKWLDGLWTKYNNFHTIY